MDQPRGRRREVYLLYKQVGTETKPVGEFLVGRLGALIIKDGKRIFLTWGELEGILEKKEDR